METVKEKLMNLISGIIELYPSEYEKIATYLIQNGVTIATDTNVGDKWVHDEGGCWYCPKCGCTPAYWEAKDDNQYGLPPYCHSCGAKLEPPKGGAVMRLIDATTLRAEFTGNFHELWHYTGIWAMIDNAPTVDAEPVRHGRWIFGTANHREYMKCSVCLKSQTPTGVFTYCPNCGAKMDEEVK